MSYFYGIVLGLFALYLLVSGIRAKSKLFASPFTRKGQETLYKNTARAGVFGMAALLAALAVVNLIAAQLPPASVLDVLSVLNLVLTVVLLTGMLLVLFLLNRLHDKDKKKQPPRPVAPRAAFYFDDEPQQAPSPGTGKPSAKKRDK